MRTHGFRKMVLGVILAALWPSAPALAVAEVEPNDLITAAQPLNIGPDGVVVVQGVVGVTSGPATNDVDFYTFRGTEGDLIVADIDGGMKPAGGGRSVDTMLAILGPAPAFQLLRANDDGGTPLDEGSIHVFDSRIVYFRLPATATYTVAVTSYPRSVRDGGVLNSTSLNANSNGSYTLIISGVTAPVQQINIAIKPGSGEHAPVNPKSKGKVPVALLGSAEFDALAVDTASLTFGRTGNESSLHHCNTSGEDVNGDGRPDVVCHFENQEANFEPGDLEGILRGKTGAGRQFEGRGVLKVVPAKRN